MRLAVTALISLATLAAIAGPSTPPDLDVYVVDPRGPVNKVEVRLIAETPRACPCPDTVALDSGGAALGHGNIPCQCPAALKMWREQLSTCGAERLLAKATTDARGHASVPAVAGATALVVTTGAGEVYAPVPKTSAPIALELADRMVARAHVTGTEKPLRVAILYADGHCVAMKPEAHGWVAQHEVSTREDAVVVAEGRTGIAAVDWTPSIDSDGVEIDLAAAHEVTGTCSKPNADVTLIAEHDHEVTKADAKGGYHFTNVMGGLAEASCRVGGAVIDSIGYDEQGTEMGEMGMVGSMRDPCSKIEVVDGEGAPVAHAVIGVFDTANFGHINSTDDHGRACVDQPNLTVDAPTMLGGQCAAHRTLKLSGTVPDDKAIPIQISLPITPLHRTKWHGRVVTPEHTPVAGASVYIGHLHSKQVRDCEERIQIYVHTASDGTFELPELPDADLDLEIAHDFYANVDATITNTGASRDLVVDRGASWRGKILDPDGHPITKCEIFMTTSASKIRITDCKPDGAFSFGALPPGVTKLDVRLHDHALGESRDFITKITFKPREQRVGDVKWPRGEPIAGKIVDQNGVGVANARISARHDEQSINVLADAEGHFEFVHLEPGTWTLEGDWIRGPTTKLDVATKTRDVRLVIKR